MKPIEFRGKETMSYNKTEFPSAEGAEEILKSVSNRYGAVMSKLSNEIALDAMQEFAALTAGKMVEEKLREELLNYEIFCGSLIDKLPHPQDEIDAMLSLIDKYLKSRE